MGTRGVAADTLDLKLDVIARRSEGAVANADAPDFA